MRIGILTFHYGSNYGGVLQCYAFQQVLKGMGHDVYVINYVPHDSLKKFLFVLLYFIRKRNVESLKALWHYILYHKKSRAVFRDFRNHYLFMTKEEKDIEKYYNIELEAIFVGSDQVWNYSQQKRSTYFLGWLKNVRVKKLSYAACCGHNVVNEEYREELIKQLGQFDSISVRSEETVAFIKQLTGQNVPVVADPTFLYEFEEFLSKKDGNYILTYILTEDIKGGNANAIDEIKKYYPGVPVYSIVISDRQPRLCNWADKQLFDVSPSDWVNLISNCKLLYTDSYHGTVFSMKFQKPFIAYYNNETSAPRFKDLKSKFDLKNIVTSVSEVSEVLLKKDEKQYDTKDSIRKFVEESKRYIDNSLNHK